MVDGYLLFVVVVLGLIEGLTEFLPISSTFHVVFCGNILGFDDHYKIEFLLNVILQLGAVFSVLIIFWKEFILELIKSVCSGDFICCKKSGLCCLHIILGILPILILGLVFYENIKNIFHIRYMLYSLIFGGVLLLVSELCSRKFYMSNSIVSRVDRITFFQAFLVGCFQCLALFPGFSRSGATISGGLLVGMDRRVSSTFSFLLAIPIMFCATILVLHKNCYVLFFGNILFFIVGFLISFIVSFFTVKIFIRIISSVSFIPFVIYRFILAFLIYFFDLV